LQRVTGEAHAIFQTIDPETELHRMSSTVLAPEDGTDAVRDTSLHHPGEGRPAHRNADPQCRHDPFDFGETIATNQVDPHDPARAPTPTRRPHHSRHWRPTSTIVPLPAVIGTRAFTVAWSGADDTGGSGVRAYDVFVSTDGGPFASWLVNTSQTSATFTGTSGHAYAFFSVAIDNVGNRQPMPAVAQAQTFLSVPPPPAPLPPAASPARPSRSHWQCSRSRAKGKWVARITFAGSGLVREILSPFQKTQWQRVVAALEDLNGDGISDVVRFTARRGKTTATRIIPL
jgi:hypothetical protein